MLERKKYLNHLKKELSIAIKDNYCFSLVFDFKGSPFIVKLNNEYFCEILDFETFLPIKECSINDLDYELLKQTSTYLEKYSKNNSFVECLNKSQNKIYFKIRKRIYNFFLSLQSNNLEENH